MTQSRPEAVRVSDHDDLSYAAAPAAAPRRAYAICARKVSVTSKVSITSGSGGTWSFFPFLTKSKTQSISILSDVSLLACPGRLFGIVGKLGAGKSTLLNLLAGRSSYKPSQGSVSYVPCDVSIPLSEPPSPSELLAQSLSPGLAASTSSEWSLDLKPPLSLVGVSDEHLLPNLTVTEALKLVASVRMPRAPASFIKQRVDMVISRMGLDSCRNVRAGGELRKGLSSGERRRLTIAMELLDPSVPVLFVDEPTTGVDSSQSREVMQLLRDLARAEGKTVVCTLYQPSSAIYDVLDDLLVLHRGQVLYHGPAVDVKAYFAEELARPCPEHCGVLDFVLKEAVKLDALETHSGASLLRKGKSPLQGPTRVPSLASESASTPRQPSSGISFPPATAQSKSSFSETSAHQKRVALSPAPSAAEGGVPYRDAESTGDAVPRAFATDAIHSTAPPDSLDKPLKDGVDFPPRSTGSLETLGSWVGHFKESEKGRLLDDLTLSVEENRKKKIVAVKFSRLFRGARCWGESGGSYRPQLDGEESSGRSGSLGQLFVVLWLAWRFLLNTVRSPVLFWTPLIISLIQGLLLGGVMYRYRDELPPHSALNTSQPLIPDGTFTESAWGKYLIEGVGKWPDGHTRRPLLDLLDIGADGEGSFPITNILTNKTNMLFIRDTVQCAYDKIDAEFQISDHFPPHKYPWNLTESDDDDEEGGTDDDEISNSSLSFKSAPDIGEVIFVKDSNTVGVNAFDSVEPTDEDSTTDSEESREVWPPQELISDVVTVLQLAQYAWDWDWSEAKACFPWEMPIVFWVCMLNAMKPLADPVVTCAGLPELPNLSRRLTELPATLELQEEELEALVPVEHSRAAKMVFANQDLVLSTIATLERRMRMLEIRASYSENLLSSSEVFDDADDSAPAVEETSTSTIDPKLDAPVLSWDTTGASASWDWMVRIFHDLLPGDRFKVLLKRVISPNTGGDLEALPNWDNWVNLVDVGKLYLEGVTECDSSFCTSLRRGVNKIKYALGQRVVPDLVTNAWIGLLMTGGMFACVATLGFFCFDALLTFHKDRLLFNREVANGCYSPWAFFLARNLADLPLQMIPALSLATTWALLSQFVADAHSFGLFLGLSALICFSAYGFCYMISAATPKMEIAIIIAPMVLLLWLILAGFILRSDSEVPVWLRWLRYASLHRYGWFGVMLAAFPEEKYSGILKGKALLWLMGVNSTSLRFNAAILAIFGVSCRLIGFVLLTFAYRNVGVIGR